MKKARRIAVSKAFQRELTQFEGIPVHIQTARNQAVKLKELYLRANKIKEVAGIEGAPSQIANYFAFNLEGFRTSAKKRPWSIETRQRQLKKVFSRYGLEIELYHEKVIAALECLLSIEPPPSEIKTGFNYELFRPHWLKYKHDKEQRLFEYRQKYGMIARSGNKPTRTEI